VRFAALFLALAACASPQASSSAPPRPDAWAPLTWEERHSEMTFKVHPNMGRLFQRHDGKPAPDLTCRTCHGPDAAEVAYAMPHGLPPLDPAHMPDERSAKVRFMRDEVTPTMADLLGVDRRSFSCFGCHPRSR
jgi:hypothetical protein